MNSFQHFLFCTRFVALFIFKSFCSMSLFTCLSNAASVFLYFYFLALWYVLPSVVFFPGPFLAHVQTNAVTVLCFLVTSFFIFFSFWNGQYSPQFISAINIFHLSAFLILQDSDWYSSIVITVFIYADFSFLSMTLAFQIFDLENCNSC